MGTSLLVPSIDDPAIDLHQHFYGLRVPYFTVAAIFWLWAIFLFPVLTGKFAPTVPALLVFLAIAATLRFTANPKIHATLAIATWLMIMSFVAIFAMRLGAVADAVKPGA